MVHLPRFQGPDPGLDTDGGESDVDTDTDGYDSEGFSSEEDDSDDSSDELPNYRLSDAEMDDFAFQKKGKHAVCHVLLTKPVLLLTCGHFLENSHTAGTQPECSLWKNEKDETKGEYQGHGYS